MDPPQQPTGRARGRGRGLFQHPPPFHTKDGHPGPQREPWSLTSGPPRPPAPQPGREVVGLKHSSSDDSGSGSMGRGISKLLVTGSGTSGATGGSDPSKRTEYPDARADNIRGAIRPSRIVSEAMLYTRPSEIASKVGTSGQKITCEVNYFRLRRRPGWNIYRYRVDFAPDVPSSGFRRYLIGTLKPILGGYMFDGTQLFMIRLLDEVITQKVVKGQNDDTEYHVTLKFTGVISMSEAQSIHVLNLILRRAMDGLKLETIGRNKFDPLAKILVPNLRLEIWPGYITSIRQHEEDILVCAELTHKVMRNETVLDIIKRIRQEERDFKNKVAQVLLGTTVLTKYNNKTYRIDEITYDVNPSSTFKMKEVETTYVDYYMQKYQLRITDRGQPMLISNVKKKDLRGGAEQQEVLLVPELCQATGLTDEMRANFRTLRDIAQHTKIGPASRIDRLLKFNRRLATSAECAQHLKDWDMELEPQLVTVPARVLPYPDLLFGDNKKAQTNNKADWTSEFRNNSMALCVPLKRWFLITPNRAIKEAEDFVKALQRAGNGMHFPINNPRFVQLANDTQTAVSDAIAKCSSEGPQLIMFVVSNNQADRYATIKKRCYIDYGIPSQVMVLRTITPKDKTKGISGLLSVATKVAIQMNTKLGGLPWMIGIPISGLMTVGYDVCHDPKNKSLSWGALVATMDLKKCNREFFTAVNRHANGEELSNYLMVNMGRAVQQFYEINGSLPERILFFRDGVGDSQIEYVVKHEVESLKTKLNEIYARQGSKEVQLLYMVVTKRVNTRIFFDRRNPDPGTCIDDIITLPERYDFYLVPQTVREGTVTPTGFNIIHDTFGLPPDKIQILTFRFTYLYYNWSGTVRVPALCQYAHKLAFLASQSLQAAPSTNAARNLERTLYFL